MFFDGLDDYGAAPAFITPDGEIISYRDLAKNADDFAAQLSEGKALVFIETCNSPEPLTAYLGALRHGHTVHLVERTGTEAFATLVDKIRPHFIYKRDAHGNWILERRESDAVLHRDLALLLSTSGTTGSTKLVRLSYENLGSNADAIARYLEITADHRTITTLPAHYSYGLSVINSHLAVGASIVLTEESVTSTAFWTLFRENNVASFAGVPHTYELLDRGKFDQMDLPSLRYFTQAGGKLSPERVRRFAELAAQRNQKFFVMYGQTEASPRMTYLPPEMARDYPDCIGVPIPGGKLALIDDDGNPVKDADKPGELVYEGPNVMMGYASEKADLAFDRTVTKLFTGDVACRNRAGLYYIVGRKKRFIKPFGYRVNLDELQDQLHAKGFDVVFTGDDSIVTIGLTDMATREEVLAVLHETTDLPNHLYKFVELPEIPRLANGKIDYKDVQRRAEELASDSATPGVEKDRSGLRKWLGELGHDIGDIVGIKRKKFRSVAEAFAWTFNKRDIDPGESFVSLGGDSLSYILVADVIEEHLGHLPDNWERMSIAELTDEKRAPRQKFTLPTEVLLRALAIVAIVAAHAELIPYRGGMNALLILAGLSFAKFMWSDRPRDVAKGVATRIFSLIIPSYIAIFVAIAWSGNVRWPTLLFYENFITYASPYWNLQVWFLQVLFQIYIFMSVLAYVPKVARFGVERRYAFGLIFTVATALLQYELARHNAVFNVETEGYLPQFFLWQFGLGWMIFASDTIAKRILTYGVLVAILGLMATVNGLTPDFLFQPGRLPWLVIGCALLLATERVWMSRSLGVLITLIAMSSYYIYLFHLIFSAAGEHLLGWDAPIAKIFVGIVGSVCVWIAAELITKRVVPLFQRPKSILKRV